MKRFFVIFVLIFLCLSYKCSAGKSTIRLPRLDIAAVKAPIAVEDNPILEDYKINFINSLMIQVWNEDFGKFTEFFCKCFFKLPPIKLCESETFLVTENTILLVEGLMKYLYQTSTKGCLDLFRCWIDFYKNFRCGARKKEIIFDSLKEFICRFSVEMAKSFYITSELLRERTEIMCELYDMEDKKIFSL